MLLGSMFSGIAEAAFLLRLYLKDMTSSELFVAMTALHASMSGSAIDALLDQGVSYFLHFAVNNTTASYKQLM